jgi:serine/threonine-protein kinase RIO1
MVFKIMVILVGCTCVATESNYNTITYMSLLYVIDMCPCVATEVKDSYETLIRNDKHHYNMQNPCGKHYQYHTNQLILFSDIDKSLLYVCRDDISA